MKNVPSMIDNDLLHKITSHLNNTKIYLNMGLAESIHEISSIILNAGNEGRSIYIFGNGGSATTAMHMANDFSRIICFNNRPLNSICLNTNMSTFSAIANDCGYEYVFTEQLKNILKPKDILIGISASGNSPNCVAAFELGEQLDAFNIGLLGFDGGKMKKLCNHLIHFPINDYYISENLHLVASHAITFTLKSYSVSIFK